MFSFSTLILLIFIDLYRQPVQKKMLAPSEQTETPGAFPIVLCLNVPLAPNSQPLPE